MFQNQCKKPRFFRALIYVVCLMVISPIAGKKAKAADIIAKVLNDNRQPIRHAVVYADPKAVIPPAPQENDAAIDQIDKMFKPFVSVVRVGTRIKFPNNDNIQHHVYSFSRANKFELPLYAGQVASPVIFDKEGAVVLGCNIHDWMMAHVLVVKTPYFAVTDQNGQAFLNDLPDGDYKVQVWHPGMRKKPKIKPQMINISAANKEVKFNFRLKARGKWWRNRPDTSESEYGSTYK